MRKPKPVDQLTDDELADEIREHVNAARHRPVNYNSVRARAVFKETKRRGWNLHTPSR